MAEEQIKQCAHPTCSCRVPEDTKYCSRYCEDAEKSHVLEIGCGCECAGCR